MRERIPRWVFPAAFGGANGGLEFLEIMKPALINNGSIGEGFYRIINTVVSMEATILNSIGLEHFGRMLLHGTTNERLFVALGVGVALGTVLGMIDGLRSST